jgi:TonB family protein
MTRHITLLVAVLVVCLAPTAFAQDTEKPADPAPVSRPITRIRVGGNVAQAQILRQVQPVYPPVANAARITGTVVLHAIIGRDGTVQQLQFVSGPPVLMTAAMDVVKQWVFKPTLLNGNTVEVDTQISVVFTLDHDKPAAPDSQPGAPPSIDPQLTSDI